MRKKWTFQIFVEVEYDKLYYNKLFKYFKFYETTKYKDKGDKSIIPF